MTELSWDKRAQYVADFANHLAVENGCDEVDSGFILTGLVKEHYSPASHLLKAAGITVPMVLKKIRLRDVLSPLDVSHRWKIRWGRGAEYINTVAMQTAGEMKSAFLGAEHLLFAICHIGIKYHEGKLLAAEVIKSHGVLLEDIMGKIKEICLPKETKAA